MKKSSLKKMSFLLAILMVIVSISGCGKKEIEGIAKGADVKLNGKDIYPIQCDDTLQFWFEATAVWETKYSNFADTPIGQELKKKTGVNIEYVHPSAGQSGEQFQILLVSDELPNIVNNNWYSYPGGPEVAIADNYIYELNDIVDTYCPGLKKVMEDHPDWAKAMKTDSGSIYAFPAITDGDPLPTTYGLVLRADWLKKLGIEVPRNIGEWEKVLTAFKEELGAENPFSANKTAMTQGFAPAFGIYDGWYVDDGKVKYGQAQPEYKDFLMKMNEWYEKGLIDRGFMSFESKKHQANMLNGVTGFAMAWAGSGVGGWLEGMAGEEFDIQGV